MKALEFKSKIKGNHIQIPQKMQSEFNSNQDKNVRVIVLMEDPESSDEFLFKQSGKKHFLDGYDDSDSIYDNY